MACHTAGAVCSCTPSAGPLTSPPLRLQVALRRVPTPAVIAVEPDRGYHSQAQWVTVQGYGFELTAHLTCAFISAEERLYARSPYDVAFVSATEIRCRQPPNPRPFSIPSYLEVSVDGQVFSSTLIRCACGGRGSGQGDPQRCRFRFTSMRSARLVCLPLAVTSQLTLLTSQPTVLTSQLTLLTSQPTVTSQPTSGCSLLPRSCQWLRF